MTATISKTIRFKSPVEFSAYMKTRAKFSASELGINVESSLVKMCEFLVDRAKSKFGHYPETIKWPELADATKTDRVRKGFSENDPLLRDGTLRDSIEFVVSGSSAVVGSTSEIMLYQEKGTYKTGWSGKGIPPRPVFLLTLLEDGDAAAELFFSTFVRNLGASV